MSSKSSAGRQGEFFAIDCRVWARICNAGTINEAAAYLVLAQGTGGNNRSTAWSATSLKTYAGISWNRAKHAIQRLIERGFIRRSESCTTGKPRYELLTWAEFIEAQLTEQERAVIAAIRNGDYRSNRRDRTTLELLTEKGLIGADSSGHHRILDSTPATNASESLIWLPNTLVTGTIKREDSPVKRLRSSDLWTLRLFIDLYSAHNLRDDGGISPWLLRSKYERKKVGERGIFTVWAFRNGNQELSWTGAMKAQQQRPLEGKSHPVWESIYHLERLGLLTFVPHLWDSNTREAEILHGYGVGSAGEPAEIERRRCCS